MAHTFIVKQLSFWPQTDDDDALAQRVDNRVWSGRLEECWAHFYEAARHRLSTMEELTTDQLVQEARLLSILAIAAGDIATSQLLLSYIEDITTQDRRL